MSTVGYQTGKICPHWLGEIINMQVSNSVEMTE
jgi:hypothetical protein